MNVKDISKATDPDLRTALGALQRASLMARETAMQTDTELVIVKNGQMLRITADELRKIAAAKLDAKLEPKLATTR